MTPEEKRERARAACRKWREAHPDRAREAERRWRAANPDYEKAWRQKNRDKTRATAARYYARHHAKELARGEARYHNNPARERDRVREYRAKHRERSKANEAAGHRRRQYGLTPEAFDALMAAHNGRCAICRREFAPKLHPCVDHDHDTGAVRGLLCRYCNLGLGYYERSSFAVSAAAYLARHAGSLQTDAA